MDTHKSMRACTYAFVFHWSGSWKNSFVQARVQGQACKHKRTYSRTQACTHARMHVRAHTFPGPLMHTCPHVLSFFSARLMAGVELATWHAVACKRAPTHVRTYVQVRRNRWDEPPLARCEKENVVLVVTEGFVHTGVCAWSRGRASQYTCRASHTHAQSHFQTRVRKQ